MITSIKNAFNSCLNSFSCRKNKNLISRIGVLFQEASYTKEQQKLIEKRLPFLIKRNLKIYGFPPDQSKLNHFIEKIKKDIIQLGSPTGQCSLGKVAPEIQILRQRLLEGNFHGGKFLNKSVFKAFFRKDEALLAGVREHFQAILDRIGERASKLPQQEYSSIEVLIGSVLSFVTYFNLQNNDELRVPQLIEGEWKSVSYRVERIELTPSWMGSPMTAFGLTSSSELVAPLLLMKGTTYPADDGFALSLLSDINLGCTPGTFAFYLAKNKLRGWLKNAAAYRKAKVYGQSLGGSLTLLIASHFSKYLDDACAYSSTALMPHDLRKWKKKSLRNPAAYMPNVKIFCQENDLVSLAGFSWAKEWEVYRVYAQREYNFIHAHVQTFLFHSVHLMEKVDLKRELRKPSRIIIATLHLICSVPLFIISLQFYALYLLIRKAGKIIQTSRVHGFLSLALDPT
ncbi:hypothetical protein PHSC3_000206 [Chlamydiales bacterium STE3]|nr:hypothetical protein PHSC3_000206 [Chlamydiales bacterium STE3]